MMTVSRKSLCCIAKVVNHCDAQVDDIFTTCTDLLGSSVLQYIIWAMCLGGFVGNAIVLMYRVLHLRSRTSQNIMLVNLAMADLLTNVYLLMLSITDIRYKGTLCQSPSYGRNLSCVRTWLFFAPCLQTLHSTCLRF